MLKTFTYKAFGLIIKSDFEIPELLVSNGVPDVEIKIEKVPEKLEGIINRGVRYQAGKNEFLLKLDNIANYYVVNGNQISVELIKKDADKEVRLFLLGSAFGALFIQRGLLPIHGSAVKFSKSATIFTGLSGVGKSSIAAYFVSQAYQVLADDISVINHNLEVVPGFPKMKLWNDILQKLEIKDQSLEQIRPDMMKFQLPINENYFNEPLPLANIIIISTKNSPGFEFEELTGIKKFNAVKNNTFRYRFVKGLDKQQDHFQVLNKLLPEVKVYKVDRPQSPLLLNEFGDFLLKKLNLDV
jgi:hypothetical protein